MNVPQSQIKSALEDVRKAYRLLHDYQRMVLDAVSYIGKQLGLTYTGGWPKFSDGTPRPGKGGLNFWAWDWLNLAFYEFNFEAPGGKEGKALKLSIFMISDTGFFCSEKEDLVATDVSDFLPVERSTTEIGFVLSKGGWPNSGFLNSREEVKTFIETGGELSAEHTAEGYLGKCVPLSRLVNEAETNLLVLELVAWAKSHGIPLQTNDRKF